MEKNEYHLIIDIQNSGGKGGAISQQSKEEKQIAERENAIKRLVRFEIAKPFVQSTKQIIMNNVDTYYGSSELSQRIQFGLDIAHTTNSAFMQGVALSAVLGISKVAGGVLSLGLAVGQKMMDIAVKQNEINNKAYIENQSLQILRGRAGVQFNRSRVGE